MLVTSLPASVLAAEPEVAAGDAEAYLANVSGPDVADYAEAQDDISTSGDMDAVANDPEESPDESLSGDDPADQEDAVISDDPIDDDTDADDTSEEETDAEELSEEDDELFGLEEPEETEPLGDHAPFVVTGDGTEAEPWVVGTWAKLSEKMAAGGYIELGEDVSPGEGETFLSVPSEKEVTLDLNGHIIDRALTEVIEDGYIIKVAGTLTLKDSTETEAGNGTGTVKGGYNTGYGGGLLIDSGGAVNLLGGEISGNKAANGGGVYSTGTVIMSGGSINDNTAERGGGVETAGGTMDMQGGSISSNYAGSGGGVFLSGASSFSISGGSICDNSTYVNELGTGGGVSVSGTCSFTMSGGRISGNISCWGSGISCRATNSNKTSVVSITGGEITGNTVRDYIEEEDGVIYRTTGKGGGIHLTNRNNILNVSGSSRITGNKHDDMDDNVLLDNYLTVHDPGVITVTGTLNEDAQIGVGMIEPGGVITSGLKGNGTLNNFTSDRGSQIVLNEAGEALMCSGVARVVKMPEKANNHENPYYSDAALCFTGYPIELVTPGEAAYGTMMYALGDKDNKTPPDKSQFGEAVPTAVSVGYYRVWYYADGYENFADTEMAYVDCRIVNSNHEVNSSQMIYYTFAGKTEIVTDIMAFLGITGEVTDVRKSISSSYPDDIISIGKDDEGQWMITTNDDIGFYSVSAYIYVTVDGKEYGFLYDVSGKKCLFIFDPNYKGSELIRIEGGAAIPAPSATREGYRLVAWVDHLTDKFNADNYTNSWNTSWDCVFPGEWCRINSGDSFGSDSRHYYAVWEPLESDADLSDVNVMKEKDHSVHIGGKNWLQIGEGGGKRLFIAEEPIGEYRYQSDAVNNCSTLYNDSFTDQEKAAVIPHGGSTDLFLLSAQEALKYLPSPLERSSSVSWWLRSYDEYRYGFYINEDGFLRLSNNYPAVSRPALVLDESAVLLESAAVNGKPDADNNFRVINTEGVQKFTLIDTGRAFTASPDGGSVVKPGGFFVINYQGTGTAENEYVSALLQNEDGEVRYSSSPFTESGTWAIKMPSDLPEGRYQLKVFSEQRNGENESDCASIPVILPISVSSSAVAEITISNGDKTGDQTVTYGDEITLTAAVSDRQRNSTLAWTSSDPAVVSVDRTSGKIRARKVGTATVTVEYRSKNSVGMASAVITVEPKLLTLTVNGQAEILFDWYYHYPDITLNGVLEGDSCRIIAPMYKVKDEYADETHLINDHCYDTSWLMYFPGTYQIHVTSADLSNSNYVIEDTTFDYTIRKIPLYVEWGETEFEYDGQEHLPEADLTGGRMFIDSYDGRLRWFKGTPEFSVSCAGGSPTEPGTYTAAAACDLRESEDYRPETNYPFKPYFYYRYPPEEEMTKEFRIVKADISRAEVTLGNALTYNGYVQPQSIASVKIGDLEVPASDYVITGNTATDAGTYKLTITAKEDSVYFTGTKEVEFTIAKKSITPSVRVGDGTQTYPFTGKEITPGFEVRESFESEDLLTDKDYSCTITDNVNAGEGKITITAKEDGNYSFALTAVNFTIDPVFWEGGDTAELSRNYLFNEKVSDGIDLSEYLPENCGEITVEEVTPTGTVSYEAGREPKIVGNNLTYTVSGNGFLYNMVRIITGTLILAGNGH